MPYAEDQAEILLSLPGIDFNTFVVAGPADANEAQTIKKLFPHASIFGFEPLLEYWQQQIDEEFPGVLINAALSSSTSTRELCVLLANPRSSSIAQRCKENTQLRKVSAYSLDDCYSYFCWRPPIGLWLDVEGAELSVLLGAKKLLRRRLISVLNVESYMSEFNRLRKYLRHFDYRISLTWNEMYSIDPYGKSGYRADVLYTPSTFSSASL